MKRHLSFVLFVICTLTLTTGALGKDLSLRQRLHIELQKSHKPAPTYHDARKFLFGKLHLEINNNRFFIEDVYCHINFGSQIGVGEMKIPDSNKLNTEHTWPQSRFVNRERRAQKTDLHHLFPSQNKANSYRANMIFADVDGKKLDSGCNVSKKGMAKGTKIDAFEPPNDHKGNVARALFYFSVRYQTTISQTEEKYLRAWNELDPPNDHERLRNDLIEDFQGNRNPFIDNPKLVDEIKNF